VTELQRHPIWGRLGLSLASTFGSILLCLTLLAVALGGWHFVAMGTGALLLCLATALASWLPRRRRLAAGIAAVGLIVSLPVLLPVPHASESGDALIRSHSVFGGDGGTPWFAGLPERALVRTGEKVAWQQQEAETVARFGGVHTTYSELDGLFARTESRVLDSWLFDRGHYFLAVPPDASSQRPAPLVVFLHGSGGNFQAFPAWLAPFAAKRGIATAYPTWGYGDWQTPDAATRVAEVIDHAAATAPIDPKRVVLCGLSAGAVGAVSVQAALPGRFRGVALISGAPFRTLDGAARTGTPWYLVHGQRDGHLPFQRSVDLARTLREAGSPVTFDEQRYVEFDHALLLVRHDEVFGGILDWAAPLLSE
jgi:predicted esterase